VDQVQLGGVLELAPEVADVHVHDVALGVEVEVPHLLEQLGAADDFLGPQQEMFEQLELFGGEFEFLAFDLDLVLQPVELDRPIAQELGAARAAAPFRVIRNSDLSIKEEDVQDLLKTMESELRRRDRRT